LSKIHSRESRLLTSILGLFVTKRYDFTNPLIFQLSPYKCAIHGFINSGSDTLECVVCNARIEIIDPLVNDEIYDEDKGTLLPNISQI
jgi:hypothetical protein